MRLGISLYALAIVVAVFMLPSISFPFAARTRPNMQISSHCGVAAQLLNLTKL